MHTSQYRSRIMGITLIEALIALVIISIGLLAVARLHGDLIAGSSLSKTRTEAVQLANTRLEEIRTRVMEADCSVLEDIENNTGVLSATSANIDWNMTITHHPGPDRLLAVVLASWVDAKNQAHSVTTQAEIICDNPRLAANLARPNDSLIPPPGGNRQAYRGYEEEQYEAGSIPGTNPEIQASTLPGVTPINDEVYVYVEEVDNECTGRVELIDADGTVLIVMNSSNPCEGFSTISGKVYISQAHTLGTTTTRVDPSKIFVRSTGVSHCTRVAKEGSPPSETDGSDLFEEDDYWYFWYQCYLPENWYGNIGLMRLDGAHNSHRICLGDPSVTTDTSLWSNKHPALDIRRQYRGYITRAWGAALGYDSIGIGVDPTTRIYTETHYGAVDALGNYPDGQHHFVLTPISGNPEDTSCQTRLTGGFFGDNTGRNFCMWHDAGATDCPGTSESVVTSSITITGRIERGNSGNNRPALGDPPITIDSADPGLSSGHCTISTEHNSYYDYACHIPAAGFTGSDWSADMFVHLDTTDGSILCPNTPTGTASDDVTIYTSALKLEISGMPFSTEEENSFTLNFRIAVPGQC